MGVRLRVREANFKNVLYFGPPARLLAQHRGENAVLRAKTRAVALSVLQRLSVVGKAVPDANCCHAQPDLLLAEQMPHKRITDAKEYSSIDNEVARPGVKDRVTSVEEPGPEDAADGD